MGFVNIFQIIKPDQVYRGSTPRLVIFYPPVREVAGEERTMKELNEKYQKRYDNTIENLNMTRLHEDMVCSQRGMGVWVYEDGTITTVTSGTIPSNESTVVCCFTAWGKSSTEEYLEGWGEWDPYAETFYTDDGRELTENEAIKEAIQDGDWTDQEQQWRDEIRYAIEQEQERDEENEAARYEQEEYDRMIRNMTPAELAGFLGEGNS